MTDERITKLDKMFRHNQGIACRAGYEGVSLNSFATALTVGQLMEERDKAQSHSTPNEDVKSHDTSTAMIKALRKAFTNVEILASHLDFSDITEITGYRYDKESRRTYFRIKGRMAVSDINGIATDLNAVRMVLGLSLLQEEEKTA